MEYLQRYTWPGNVRQLKNLRAAGWCSTTGAVTGRHVVDELTIGQRRFANEAFGVTDPWRGRSRRPAPPPRRPPPWPTRSAPPWSRPWPMRGQPGLAARLLGISCTALYQKLERFRLS